MEARRTYEWNLGSSYFYLDGAESLLAELSTKYDLYLMSNGTAAVQDRRIAASGIDKYFKGIFISEKVGYNKPSREFFDLCFKQIPDFSKDESIIIGDSLSSDIQGGINAGILTCHYNPSGEMSDSPRPNYTIKTLEELPLLLESI
jgi:2-haloacid dehalogenase